MLVTHDATVAGYADRELVLRDGRWDASGVGLDGPAPRSDGRGAGGAAGPRPVRLLWTYRGAGPASTVGRAPPGRGHATPRGRARGGGHRLAVREATVPAPDGSTVLALANRVGATLVLLAMVALSLTVLRPGTSLDELRTA